MASGDDRLVELLEELVAWTRFASRTALIGLLDAEGKDAKHLLAFELSDGTRSQKQVGDLVGLSQPSVSLLWKRWRRLGIARDVGGRARHIARPTDIGMERAQQLVTATPKVKKAMEAGSADG
jgi:hypothetical protein